jgi:hypothetical protein
MPEVFLSYARADGEGKAAALRGCLRPEIDINIKQDRLFLEGGVGWWKQITAPIDSVDFLVPLMTPAALASGNVQRHGASLTVRGQSKRDDRLPRCHRHVLLAVEAISHRGRFPQVTRLKTP